MVRPWSSLVTVPSTPPHMVSQFYEKILTSKRAKVFETGREVS